MLLRRLFLIACLLLAAPAMAQDKSIVVASTTSTEDSGLFGYLLPLFKATTRTLMPVLALNSGSR